jgi:hypothetical protein
MNINTCMLTFKKKDNMKQSAAILVLPVL